MPKPFKMGLVDILCMCSMMLCVVLIFYCSHLPPNNLLFVKSIIFFEVRMTRQGVHHGSGIYMHICMTIPAKHHENRFLPISFIFYVFVRIIGLKKQNIFTTLMFISVLLCMSSVIYDSLVRV